MMNKVTAAANTSPIAGYYLWLDSSDASTFSFSSGTVVSQWRDKSANALAFNPVSTATAPSRNGDQNGLPTIVFDRASSHSLRSTVAASTWKFMHDGTPTTVMYVFKDNLTAYDTGKILTTVMFGVTEDGMDIVVSPGTGTSYALNNVANAYNYVSPGTNGSVYNSGYYSFATYPRHRIGTTVFDLTNATTANKILWYNDNGTSANTGAILNTFTSPSADDPSVTLSIGGNSYNYFKGEIAEILIYKSILSQADRVANANYLKAKWNIY